MKGITARPSREADLRLGGLSLWINGREFPDCSDFWDGNWLRVTAEMRASGSIVRAEGPFLRTSEVAAFAGELRKLQAATDGTAELRCLEPELHVSLALDRLGHVAVTIALTPDPLNQFHRFELDLDQTYLPLLLGCCESILQDYPVKAGEPD